MSLLGTQVYANDTTPVWLAANGGGGGQHIITGDLEVTGSITCSGAGINAVDDSDGFTVEGGGGAVETRLQHIQGVGPRTLFQSTDPIYFTQPTQVNGNTYLQIAAPITNDDLLRVGGAVSVVGVGIGGNQFAISGDGPGLGMVLSSTNPVKFTQVGQINGNSRYELSADGANQDLFLWGGRLQGQELALADATLTPLAPVVGTATLTAGTTIINTTACDVGSYIFLSRTDLNTTTAVGELRVSNKGANDFTVVSVDVTGAQVAGDDSSFDWMIVGPAT